MWLFSHFATWFNWLAVSYHFQRGGLGKGFKDTLKLTSFMDVPLRRSQFPWEKFLVFKRLSGNSFLFSVDIFTPGFWPWFVTVLGSCWFCSVRSWWPVGSLGGLEWNNETKGMDKTPCKPHVIHQIRQHNVRIDSDCKILTRSCTTTYVSKN